MIQSIKIMNKCQEENNENMYNMIRRIENSMQIQNSNMIKMMEHIVLTKNSLGIYNMIVNSKTKK
jgi:putative ubiquitin-RnfH superfamily antitoxin RatB of RatAB toxin-antitoxin module